jgi:hypothetical protein
MITSEEFYTVMAALVNHRGVALPGGGACMTNSTMTYNRSTVELELTLKIHTTMAELEKGMLAGSLRAPEEERKILEEGFRKLIL